MTADTGDMLVFVVTVVVTYSILTLIGRLVGLE